MALTDNSPYLDITVGTEDILSGVKVIISNVKPTWDLTIVKFKVFTEGISNQLMGCFHPTEQPAVLVRVYGIGTELFVDRAAERRTMLVLANAGLGPDLLATFVNGLVYNFVPGEVLTVESVTSPTLWPLVAQRLGAMHRLPADGQPLLWDRLSNFINLISTGFFSEAKFQSVTKLFADKVALAAEVGWLESHLTTSLSPAVFCHNDLLLANVIFNESNHDVTFIDYEYSSTNHQAYDIANHFNEYAGVENADFTRVPCLEYQREWVCAYLTAYLGEPPSQQHVGRLVREVQQFMAASHLFWGLWSCVQAVISNIDFDFVEYAGIRLSQYIKGKPFVSSAS